MTPTQELILEVLAARVRLGETLWTFSSRHGRALRSLQALGYVTLMHGTVERTVRASLTVKGRAEALSDRYVPPVLQETYERGRRDGAQQQRELLGL